MHVTYAVISGTREDAIDHLVEGFEPRDTEVGGDVLGLDMKGRSDGFADLVAVLDGGVAEEERREDMDDVCPVTSLLNDGRSPVGIEETVLLADRLEDGEMEDAGTEISVGYLHFFYRFGFVST